MLNKRRFLNFFNIFFIDTNLTRIVFYIFLKLWMLNCLTLSLGFDKWLNRCSDGFLLFNFPLSFNLFCLLYLFLEFWFLNLLNWARLINCFFCLTLSLRFHKWLNQCPYDLLFSNFPFSNDILCLNLRSILLNILVDVLFLRFFIIWLLILN